MERVRGVPRPVDGADADRALVEPVRQPLVGALRERERLAVEHRRERPPLPRPGRTAVRQHDVGVAAGEGAVVGPVVLDWRRLRARRGADDLADLDVVPPRARVPVAQGEVPGGERVRERVVVDLRPVDVGADPAAFDGEHDLGRAAPDGPDAVVGRQRRVERREPAEPGVVEGERGEVGLDARAPLVALVVAVARADAERRPAYLPRAGEHDEGPLGAGGVEAEPEPEHEVGRGGPAAPDRDALGGRRVVHHQPAAAHADPGRRLALGARLDGPAVPPVGAGEVVAGDPADGVRVPAHAEGVGRGGRLRRARGARHRERDEREPGEAMGDLEQGARASHYRTTVSRPAPTSAPAVTR